METFAISDHRSSTYSNILDPSIDLLPEDVAFYSTRTWFQKKWLIIISGIFLVFLIHSALHFEEHDDELVTTGTWNSSLIENKQNFSHPFLFQSQFVKSAEMTTCKTHTECPRPALAVNSTPDYTYNHAHTYFDSSMTYLVEPSHYDIQIEPIVESSFKGAKHFTFKGKVNVVMQARQELDTLILGAMDLSVEQLLYNNGTNRSVGECNK